MILAAQAVDKEVAQTQSEVDSNKKMLQTAPPSNRRKLRSEVDELQGELDMAQTRNKVLHDLLQFAGSTSGNGSSLEAQIDQLQTSVPELESNGGSGGRAKNSNRCAACASNRRPGGWRSRRGQRRD